MRGGQEALPGHVLELLEQRIEKSPCVQQRDRLVVQTKLPLAQKLREFFQCAETPRARDDAAR